MNKEIERKFLVKGDFKKYAIRSYSIVQGYLSSVPERTVRVRINADKGYLTVKGIGDQKGLSRFEWEKEIDVNDAETLLRICEPGVIEKERYLVPEDGGLTFEVDVFQGINKGLIIAEIEIPSANHKIEKPLWLGKEVTGQKKYYNAYLVKHPYRSWESAP